MFKMEAVPLVWNANVHNQPRKALLTFYYTGGLLPGQTF